MRLAVCAEMIFLDLPITERVQRIAEAGFDAEIWDWTPHDIEALAATGAMFSSMTGYIRGDFGDGADELIRTAREGYDGTVGLEAWAADGDSERALARFRAAFTPGAG